jgi:hypothetical protein
MQEYIALLKGRKLRSKIERFYSWNPLFKKSLARPFQGAPRVKNQNC